MSSEQRAASSKQRAVSSEEEIPLAARYSPLADCPDRERQRGVWWLAVFGLAGLINYAFLASLSPRFVFGQGHTDRPIVAVVMLLSAGWIAWLAACYVVRRYFQPEASTIRLQAEFWPVTLVLLLACLYRLILIPTRPIQEADLYRYLWDGRLVLAGVNPYRYTPAEIADRLWAAYQKQRRGEAETLDEDLRRLSELLNENLVQNQRLFRLALTHHGRMPTTYPPVAQAVFAFAIWLCPDTASVEERSTVLKAVLVCFDLATLLLLLAILQHFRWPLTWSVVYAWCPLVLKEVTNSGHVDSVAVFFCVYTWWLGLRQRWGWAGLVWALAVLAKVYPLALLPILLAWLSSSAGRWACLRFLAVAIAVLALALWSSRPGHADRTPITGVVIFLREWEMNDALFHLTRRALESFLPERWLAGVTAWPHWPRRIPHDAPDELSTLAGWVALSGGLAAGEIRRFGVLPVKPSFLLTYALHGLIYLALVFWLAWSTARRQHSAVGNCAAQPDQHRDSAWFAATFSALAWLFLLLPTGNPWYFLWALPWLIWARQTAWYVLVGLLAQYYLYFWFVYHYPEGGPTVWRSGLPGYRFFHDVWVWVEYGPFFAWLLAEHWLRRRPCPTP